MPFRFELVSPERLLFAGDARSVIVPGSEGQFTVLENHAPLMSTLKPGVVTVEESGGVRKLFVRGGFAEVSAAGLTILAEQAISLDDLDRLKLDADIRDFEEDLADAMNDEARREAGEKLERLREMRAALAA